MTSGTSVISDELSSVSAIDLPQCRFVQSTTFDSAPSPLMRAENACEGSLSIFSKSNFSDLTSGSISVLVDHFRRWRDSGSDLFRLQKLVLSYLSYFAPVFCHNP